MAPSSTLFDIYDGPDSDLEKRTKRSNLSTRMKTKAHGKIDPSRIREENPEHKARPRKPKQSKSKNKVKGREFAKPRRSARLEAKRQKTC